MIGDSELVESVYKSILTLEHHRKKFRNIILLLNIPAGQINDGPWEES